MAEATITLKLTPAEFDLLREELNQRSLQLLSFSMDQENKDYRAKSEARQVGAQINHLMRKLS